MMKKSKRHKYQLTYGPGDPPERLAVAERKSCRRIAASLAPYAPRDPRAFERLVSLLVRVRRGDVSAPLIEEVFPLLDRFCMTPWSRAEFERRMARHEALRKLNTKLNATIARKPGWRKTLRKFNEGLNEVLRHA